jgi:hypothetical protein
VIPSFAAIIEDVKATHAQVPELGRLGDLPTAAEVVGAEHALGCSLSEFYRRFLLEIGSGLVGHLPIHGLRPTAMYPNEGTVIDVTQRFRSEGWPETDKGPVISTDQGGNPIIERQDGTIVTFDHDFGGFHVVSSSFDAFAAGLMAR